MEPDAPLTYALLALSALAAGVMNSLAGGGTLLTFPALLLVMGEVSANATSTVALAPGSLAGTWGFRRELKGSGRWIALLIGPSLVGGLIGSLLVVWLPDTIFKMLVPWLILTATVLFIAQPVITKLTGIGHETHQPTRRIIVGVVVFQFVVALYGGYFGAGIGILMLSALSLMGLGDLNRMNAIKTLLATVINGTSIVVFIWAGRIEWKYAIVMASTAIVGGFLGAGLSRKLPKAVGRWIVIAVGLFLAVYTFVKG